MKGSLEMATIDASSPSPSRTLNTRHTSQACLPVCLSFSHFSLSLYSSFFFVLLCLPLLFDARICPHPYPTPTPVPFPFSHPTTSTTKVRLGSQGGSSRYSKVFPLSRFISPGTYAPVEDTGHVPKPTVAK